MSMIDVGTYGAKRQSMKRGSPRDLLKRLIEDNSGLGEPDILKLFRSEVLDNPDMVDAIVEYWYANNYRSLTIRPVVASEFKAKARVQAKAETAKRVEVLTKIVKARAQRMVLLDMVLPNGKPLRDSTGKDCAKAGGWLSKIAAKIKPNEVVGKTLSETQVRRLMGA